MKKIILLALTALMMVGCSDKQRVRADNPVDACCEMIIKLNELKML